MWAQMRVAAVNAGGTIADTRYGCVLRSTAVSMDNVQPCLHCKAALVAPASTPEGLPLHSAHLVSTPAPGSWQGFEVANPERYAARLRTSPRLHGGAGRPQLGIDDLLTEEECQVLAAADAAAAVAAKPARAAAK